MCSLCRLLVAKKHNFGQVLIFGDSCTHPSLPMRAKFGVLEQTQGLHLQAKFHLIVFIVSASGSQKPQFWANFDILGAPVPTPFYRRGPNLVCYSRPAVYVYLRNFVLIGLFCCSVVAKNLNFCIFLQFFGLRHLVMSPIGINLKKLSTGAQLQTFPYPTASKSFLYSNGFMAKSGAQTLTFKSVTDRQTDKQTDKKTQRFWPPRRRVKSEPHQTWHGDRGPRASSCLSKTFSGLTHSFAARGR